MIINNNLSLNSVITRGCDTELQMTVFRSEITFRGRYQCERDELLSENVELEKLLIIKWRNFSCKYLGVLNDLRHFRTLLILFRHELVSEESYLLVPTEE